VPLTTTNAIGPAAGKFQDRPLRCFGRWRGISGGGGWSGGFHVPPRPQDRWRRPHRLFAEKGLIPPVTFGRVSGKFPPMKAWIYICAIVFAAGMVAALADETNTTTQTGAITNTPANTNEVAVPPPMTATPAPAPMVAHKVKPPVVVPLTQTSAVPAQSNVTTAPLTTTNAITPPPMTVTSTPAPAVAGEVSPPDNVSLMETSAVPAQPDITAAPPSESSGTGRKGVLAISVALLSCCVARAKPTTPASSRAR
jgi:hypothetical protein